MISLTLVKEVAVRGIWRTGLILQKYSPQICFALGTVGFVGTVVEGAHATFKAEDVIVRAKEQLYRLNQLYEEATDVEYSLKDYRKDVASVYMRLVFNLAKVYGPTIALGVASIALFGEGQHILSKRNAVLLGAYERLDKAFKDYRERVQKDVGPDHEAELLTEELEETETAEVSDDDPIVKLLGRKITIADYQLWFEDDHPGAERPSRFFRTDPLHNRFILQSAQNQANDILLSKGHILLNEVFDLLGVDRTDIGGMVGWVWQSGRGDDQVDFRFDKNPVNGPFLREEVNDRVFLDFNVDGFILNLI